MKKKKDYCNLDEKNIQFRIQANLPANIFLDANGKLIMDNLYFLIFLSPTPSLGNNLYMFSVVPFLKSLRNKLFSRFILKIRFRCAWVAQLVERPPSTQVMISWFWSSSPTWGVLLSACQHRACFRSSGLFSLPLP